MKYFPFRGISMRLKKTMEIRFLGWPTKQSLDEFTAKNLWTQRRQRQWMMAMKFLNRKRVDSRTKAVITAKNDGTILIQLTKGGNIYSSRIYHKCYHYIAICETNYVTFCDKTWSFVFKENQIVISISLNVYLNFQNIPQDNFIASISGSQLQTIWGASKHQHVGEAQLVTFVVAEVSLIFPFFLYLVCHIITHFLKIAIIKQASFRTLYLLIVTTHLFDRLCPCLRLFGRYTFSPMVERPSWGDS